VAVAATLALALALGGCLNSSTPAGREATSSRRSETPAAPTPSLPASVFVLSPIGLNVRETPDPTGTRQATLPRGAQLDVKGLETVRGEAWFKVRTHDSPAVEGYVLRSPSLIIERPVETHYDPAGFSLLYPKEWTVESATPEGRLELKSPSAAEGLTVQAADDPGKLAAAPTSAGRAVREEGPLEVYGKTVFATVYRLNSGGYQFEVRLKWAEGRALLFLGQFQSADTALYKQLLASVIVSE
jgi:hypothetical protein